MENQKLFLVAIISAAATWAAMTAWPAIQELLYPPTSSTASVPDTLADNGTPLLAAGIVPSTDHASLPKAVVPMPMPEPVVPQSLSTSTRALLQTWGRDDMKYARFSVVLRATPDGVGKRPVSLNRAPLTVVKGTRLYMVKEQDDWVLVQSPSAETGWVHKQELTEKRPIALNRIRKTT
jgi:hypothetical protein